MLLVIDIGNSQTSLGLYQDQTLTYQFHKQTLSQQTEDEWIAYLFPIFEYLKLSLESCQIAVCSVVPSAMAGLEAFSRKYLSQELFEVSTKNPLPFKLNVLEPHRVGADRIANVAFVHKIQTFPAVVFDFGTAITMDVISPQGHYEGGVILPGTRLAFESLNLKTSLLPEVVSQVPTHVVGKNTIECIQSGVLHGYRHLVGGLFRQTLQECGWEKAHLYLTGGNARTFHHLLDAPHELVEDLTLQGILELYKLSCDQ